MGLASSTESNICNEVDGKRCMVWIYGTC